MTIVEKTVEIPQLQYSSKLVDVPVVAGRARFLGAGRGRDASPTGCIVEKIVEIPVRVCVETVRKTALFRTVSRQGGHFAAGGGGVRRVNEPSTTKSSSSSRAGAVLF